MAEPRAEPVTTPEGETGATPGLLESQFTFRPGGRVTPPMIPLYFRFAFPLEIQRDYFNYGVLFGLGVDIPILPILGIVLEVDTTLNRDLEWGVVGVPLEFRGGVAFHF